MNRVVFLARRCCARLPPTALACLLSYAATSARAQSTAGFDLDILRERGIDPQIAEYFKEAARFRPGMAAVNLFVNGQPRGRVQARFDANGKLCFDQKLLEHGNIKLPEQADGKAPLADAAACHDFMAAWPQTVVELRPGKEEVSLLVPTAALRPTEATIGAFERGGSAMLANYDVSMVRSKSGRNTSSFMSANLEWGFNTGDWILRAREMMSRQQNAMQRQHLYAYAQRTLVDYQSIIQAGQINVLNTAFGTGPITGVQWVPETALSTNSLNNVMVEGIASSQSRVEVRQSGALIYSTMVPSGPFALADLPLLNATSDLEVTLIETNGGQRRFTVPAASLYAGNLGARRGYSFALGKQRALGNSTARQPWLATAAGGWPLGRDSTLTAGLLGATGYQAVSWGIDTRVADINLGAQQRLSHVPAQGERGTQFSLAGTAIVAQRASLSLSTTQQTLGYRDLGEQPPQAQVVLPAVGDPGAVAQVQQNARYRGQYSASLAWGSPWLGGISVAFSRSTQFGGPSAQRITASWGKNFGFANVNLNLERQLGGGGTAAGTNPTIFYLTMSIPLGKTNVRSYVNNSGGDQRTGVSFGDTINASTSYAVTADRSSNSGKVDLAGQLSMLPRYAQVNLGYARGGTGNTTYNSSLRGGMVLHEHGLTFSPYAVQDTFGIVKVSDVAGVQVGTPYGPVWTDWKGQAVISQLPPYTETRLEVATKSLPRNVDLRNGLQKVTAGRGAITHVNFDVMRVRRLLLTVRDAQDRPLPRGAAVLDGDGQFVTTVVDDGQVFLLNGITNGKLRVVLLDEQSCEMQFTVPDQPDPNAFYEALEARCLAPTHVRSNGGADAHS